MASCGAPVGVTDSTVVRPTAASSNTVGPPLTGPVTWNQYVALSCTDHGENENKVFTIVPLLILPADSDFKFTTTLLDNGEVVRGARRQAACGRRSLRDLGVARATEPLQHLSAGPAVRLRVP